MKRFLTLASLVLALAPWAQAQTSDADFKAQQDSMSAELGRLYGYSISKMQAADPRMSKADFLRGFDVMITADTANVGYMAGLGVGEEFYAQQREMKGQNDVELNRDAFAAAVRQSLNEAAPSDSAMQAMYQDMRNRQIKVGEMVTERKSAANKAKGQQYVDQLMKSDPAYRRTASGLVYKVVAPGAGPTFADTDQVQLSYVGKHVNGDTFDASRDTATFSPGQVVAGFKEMLLLMRPGSKVTGVLPSDIAYGDRGAGRDQRTGKYAIEPGETLIFEVETYGVKKAAPAASKATKSSKPRGIKAKDRNFKGSKPRPGQKK